MLTNDVSSNSQAQVKLITFPHYSSFVVEACETCSIFNTFIVSGSFPKSLFTSAVILPDRSL